MESLTESWLERIPKVELHLHLEGAIPLDALWQLVQKYGCEPRVADLTALQERFQYRDFPHFMETWAWKNQFLRSYEDFTFVSEAVAADLSRQNIRYAEVFYSPSDFFRHGLETQALTAAIRAGLSRVPKTQVALVADLVRDRGPESASRVLSGVNEVRDMGVVGVTIGGSEQNYPPEPFAGVYDRARKLGFHTSAHAGEAAGPESVWGAIRSLKVERIGHGTRAAEDKRLLDYLAENRIPLEVCPISNMRTGVVGAIEDHPIRTFFERGLLFSVNTDDPKMFGNSLAQEYGLLIDEFGFFPSEIRSLIRQSIDVSWLGAREKQKLIGSFESDESWDSL